MMADINIGPEAGGVPGGSGGAVRIPVLPTVSTPLRDAPPISRWRGAGIPETVPVQTQDIFEGIENAGSSARSLPRKARISARYSSTS
jgi:hypothetical protein